MPCRDGLLVDSAPLDVDSATGTECVWWKRNLPCCGMRDYVFGRRTWREGEERYTISKGSTHPRKPRGANGVIRVDPYYSSWRIRPGEFHFFLFLEVKSIFYILVHWI